MSTTADNGFSSEGFDLDAILDKGSQDEDNVIYEIGGNVTAAQTTRSSNSRATEQTEQEPSPIDEAESFKAKGNAAFKAGSYLDAFDYYSDAAQSTPGLSGADILKLRKEHTEAETEKAYEKHLEETERRRNVSRHEPNEEQNEEDSNQNNDSKNKNVPNEFRVPPHEYGTQLSVYYSNRAACLLHLQRNEEAIEDCDVALLLNPRYAKAMIRRMTAYENTERTENALKDAKMALEQEPGNASTRKHVQRLERVENERMEKLKEETMGKLKDLGNSILGNFGMSLDNFNTQKDPNTGSYNISYNNN